MIPMDIVKLNPMAVGTYIFMEHNITRYNTITFSINDILKFLGYESARRDIIYKKPYINIVETLTTLQSLGYIRDLPDELKLKDYYYINVNPKKFDNPTDYVYLYNEEFKKIISSKYKEKGNLLTTLCYCKKHTYYSKDRPFIFWSNYSYISDEINIDRRIVSRCISELQELNFIKYEVVDMGDNKSNILSTLTYKLYVNNGRLIQEPLETSAILKSGRDYIYKYNKHNCY